MRELELVLFLFSRTVFFRSMEERRRRERAWKNRFLGRRSKKKKKKKRNELRKMTFVVFIIPKSPASSLQ